VSDLLNGGRLPDPIKVDAGAIRNHMAEVYSESNGYACLFEVANGTGHKVTNFADVVVMSLWPSRGFEIVGYEIKVGRGDWLHELKQPDKAWPVMQFCDRWCLLSAPGVAKMDEIPTTWGWQEFDGEKLRVRKASPVLEAKPLTRAFIGAMLRRPIRDIEAMARTVAEKRKKQLDEEFDHRVQARVSRRQEELAQAAESIDKIKELTGIDLRSWVPPAEVAAALKFALSEKPFQRYHGLNSAVSEVQGALNNLLRLQSKVAELAPPEPEPRPITTKRRTARGGSYAA
jgi:hypothetical protein